MEKVKSSEILEILSCGKGSETTLDIGSGELKVGEVLGKSYKRFDDSGV